MAKSLFDCAGKVTVVTGGNGGIGFGFAMGVAKMGGDLAIWARNAEKSAKAKAELEAAGAGKVVAYQVDVSEEVNIAQGYEAVMADFGRVDCVFANSGLRRATTRSSRCRPITGTTSRRPRCTAPSSPCAKVRG
ncbi:SDR family NAD(P)-dependent oxidoreductase [Novosphingobium resinovorum]